MKREKHGMSGTPEYVAWLGMRSRCSNPKNSRYADWGGRGITVCDRWRDSFLAFYAGDYEPSNVRWATLQEQRANRRRDPNSEKTHCPKDHEYTEANTRWYKGKRNCRTCQREAQARVNARNYGRAAA